MYEERQESNTRIPLEKKIRIVNKVNEHPNCSLKTIQHQGGGALRTKKDFPRWKNDFKNGGATLEKYEQINKWAYNRYEDARKEKRPETTRMLQTWAAQAAAQYQSDKFRFKASKCWVQRNIKAKYRIRSRKVTRYIKSKMLWMWQKCLRMPKHFKNVLQRQ